MTENIEEIARKSLDNIEIKTITLNTNYDAEERKLRRKVTITAEVSEEEAWQIEYLIKLRASFMADVKVVGVQPQLPVEAE